MREKRKAGSKETESFIYSAEDVELMCRARPITAATSCQDDGSSDSEMIPGGRVQDARVSNELFALKTGECRSEKTTVIILRS